VTDSRPRLLFGRTITYGCSGKDVQLLHELLNKDNQTLIDPQNRRSPGHVQNFFGSNTERAVKRFQKKYGIVPDDNLEYGIVEKNTIKKFRALFGNGSFYLQERRRLGIIPVYKETETELKNISLGMGKLIDRVVRVFLAIFRYWFKCKPIFSTREYAFGSYFSLSFPRAKNSPLLKLFDKANITKRKRVEILVKNGSDQEISDTDIESVIMGTKENTDTIFILITGGRVQDEDIDRLFRAFARNNLIILPLGEKDITRFEDWITKGNINACLMSLIIVAEKILSVDENSMAKNDTFISHQIPFLEISLDKMGGIMAKQLRTLIQKFVYFTWYFHARCVIEETCNLAHISRKTYHNWYNTDPVFRNIIHTSNDCIGNGLSSYDTSDWCNTDEDLENFNISKEAEITPETP
jgi:hypothetical protein